MKNKCPTQPSEQLKYLPSCAPKSAGAQLWYAHTVHLLESSFHEDIMLTVGSVAKILPEHQSWQTSNFL